MKYSIPKNIGLIDFLLRFCIGIALIYYGFFDTNLIQDEFSAYIVGIFGSINLAVALVRFCPIYKAVGINTYCQSKSSES